MPEFFGPVIMRVRFAGTCVAGMEAEPKPEWKQHTSSRTQREYGTPANCEDAIRCRQPARLSPVPERMEHHQKFRS
jgi:hypothetical protein